MSDGELLDAREAMSLLGVNETDLQTMVARGSLRAFRSAGTMKFRRDDVLGLKTEKKTDPTIIMPPATVKTKPGSGILPTVASNKKRDSSRTLPTVKPASTAATAAAIKPPAKPEPDASTSSDQIILEEFELAPSEVDPAANTQQVTAENAAISGHQTAIDSAIETGNVTVVEPGVNDIDTASATASAIAPVAVPSSESKRVAASQTRVGSGRSEPATAAPALSRVRPAVGGTGMSSVNKRAAATAAVRTAHPIMTFILILTAGMFLYTSTIVGVQLFKGNYDESTGQRVIPPFLADAPVINYNTVYANLPGIPADNEGSNKRPDTEPAGFQKK